MKRIAVLVSGGGTNLQALIDAGEACLGGKICAVLSSKKGAYALERAKAAGIDALAVPRRDYPSEAEYSRAVEAALAPYAPDLLIHAGFLSILDGAFCEKYPWQINVHPALIPAFCGKGMYGLRVHEAALAKGVKVTGATVHFVNDIPDGGPIILQRAVDVLPDDTPEVLQKRVMQQCEHELLPQAVGLFCRDRLRVENGIVTILD